MQPALPQRRRLVCHAAPDAFAPMTLPLLARLGYALLPPDALADADEDERPDLFVVDERRLAELPDDGDWPVPVVVLSGRHGVTGADPRIVAAVRRPAGLHELYRVLQQALEESPRSATRVATPLAARCRAKGREWGVNVLSLSENGCLLRSPEPLLLGSEVELALSLPRAGRMRLTGEVAYQLVPDVGLVFNATAARDRVALAAWVSEALATASG